MNLKNREKWHASFFISSYLKAQRILNFLALCLATTGVFLSFCSFSSFLIIPTRPFSLSLQRNFRSSKIKLNAASHSLRVLSFSSHPCLPPPPSLFFFPKPWSYHSGEGLAVRSPEQSANITNTKWLLITNLQVAALITQIVLVARRNSKYEIRDDKETEKKGKEEFFESGKSHWKVKLKIK